MTDDVPHVTRRRAVCSGVAVLATLASGCSGGSNRVDQEIVESSVHILNPDRDEAHEIHVVVENVTTGERLREETLVVEPRSEDGSINETREIIRFSWRTRHHEDVDENPPLRLTVTLTDDPSVTASEERRFGAGGTEDFSVRVTAHDIDIKVGQV